MEDKNKGKRYSWFALRGIVKETPENFISCTPVRILGICIGWNITMAKEGYI